MQMRLDLASKGVLGSEFGVSPWKQTEVNDVNYPVLKYCGEFVDDEVGTVRTQALVVQIQRHFFRGI